MSLSDLRTKVLNHARGETIMLTEKEYDLAEEAIYTYCEKNCLIPWCGPNGLLLMYGREIDYTPDP